MTYFYEFMPNCIDLPIYIIEAENWKQANRFARKKANLDFRVKNNYGLIWFAQNKQTPKFSVPYHLEKTPLSLIPNSNNSKTGSEFRIIYFDNRLEILKKQL